MPAVNAAIDICNLALDNLGQEANVTDVTSDPTTVAEKICHRWYDTIRRSLLRAHPWSFAKARVSISRDATDPDFGYADAYNMPTNLLTLRFIGDDSIQDFKNDFKIEKRQILLNNSGAASINIGYTIDMTEVAKFDALFVDIFALKLSLRTSYAFTIKRTLRNDLVLLLKDAMAEAKAINGQESPPIRVEKSKFKTARFNLRRNISTDKLYLP